MVPTLSHPFIVTAVLAGEAFDPTPLKELLGEPLWYRSRVVVALCDQPSTGEFLVETNWGPATGHTDTHVLVQPYLLQADGCSVVLGGEPYPLLKAEFCQRVPLECTDPAGGMLYGKTDVTAYWEIPQDFEPGAIQVQSAESVDLQYQMSGPGTILCYTKTGAWITVWKDDKYQRVSGVSKQ